MSDQPAMPTAWQAYLPLVTSLVRTLLAVVGSAGFMWAQTVSASQVEMIVGASMVLASAVWSAIQKIQAQRALNVAAANSAGMTPPKLPA